MRFASESYCSAQDDKRWGSCWRENFCRKNLGDASASPVCCLLILLLVLLFLLCLFLGCHGSILPSIFHGLLCNGVLLQLIECIESIKSDVKKKMMLTRACDRYTKVTREHPTGIFRDSRRDRRIFLVRKVLRALVTLPFLGIRKSERGSREAQASPPRILIFSHRAHL